MGQWRSMMRVLIVARAGALPDGVHSLVATVPEVDSIAQADDAEEGETNEEKDN